MATNDFVETPHVSICVNSWLELSKSDYAKVIFCDMYHDPDSSVGCRFQITDNVHEDPCDYVGLFRVGYDNLSQCLVSKMLSRTECEEDGKLLRCVFKNDELPELDDGFYQFLYVTRDNEVCGASMPFEIKQSLGKEESSDEDVVADKTEDDFLVVRSNLVEKNRSLQVLVDELSNKNQFLAAEVTRLSEAKCKTCEENAEVIAGMRQKIILMRRGREVGNARLEKTVDSMEKLAKKLEETTMEKATLMTTVDKLNNDKDHLHKIIKEKDSALVQQITLLGQDTNALLEQLEDSKVMIRALEDSKLLALREMNNLTKLLSEHKKMLQEMKCENVALKLKLGDEQVSNEKHMQMLQEVKCQNFALKLKLDDERASVEKIKQEAASLTDERNKLKKAIEKKNYLLKKEVEEGAKQLATDISNENYKYFLELQEGSTMSLFAKILASTEAEAKDKKLVDELKKELENKTKDIEKMSDQICDLQSNCMQWDDEVGDLKSHCAELYAKLSEKETLVSQLNEDCIKKDAVIEYLSKEKDLFLDTESALRDALAETTARLKEAAEIYKKQFIEIEKLKKKLRKSRYGMQKDDSISRGSSVVSQSFLQDRNSESFESQDCPPNADGWLSASRNISDSDTGEHVVGEPKKVISLKDFLTKYGSPDRIKNSQAETSKTDPPSASAIVGTDLALEKKTSESPDLHKMIEQNLANLTSCKSKDQKAASTEVFQTIPCVICEKPVENFPNYAEAMVKHLEVEHKQQMCPICGRLFDMSLPQKYLAFHVDDHFNS